MLSKLNEVISPEVRDEIILGLVDKLGPVAVAFFILLVLSQLALWKAYSGRLKDRQNEIDRMAKDNKEKQNMISELVSDLRKRDSDA